MAGIGFELRRLSQSGDLFAPLTSMGHAAVVAAGPWIMTMAALLMIGWLAAPAAGLETIGDFRVLVTYAFALSLVATAPVVMVATRVTADDIFLERFDRIRSLLVAALAVGGIASATLALVVMALLLGAPLATALVGAHLTALVGMIWVSLAFCGAVRDYRGITLGFLVGLFAATGLAVFAARLGLGAPAMSYGFGVGLVVVQLWLTHRVLTTFPQPLIDPRRAIRRLVSGHWDHYLLAAGALIGALAIWADKWIIWHGAQGTRAANGLVHAPDYDAPLFIAYLVIIPALAQFVTRLETTVFELYKRYYDDIRDHATLARIRLNARALETEVMSTLTAILLQQAAVCAIVVVSAPMIIGAAGLQYQQTGVLRFGAIATVFQFLFIGATALLLFFERHTIYLLLQIMFLVLTVAGTYISLDAGEATYGLGSLIAALIASIAAFLALERTLRDLDFITFVVGTARGAGRRAEP